MQQTQYLETGRCTISFNGSVLACAFSATLTNGGRFTAPTGSVTVGFGPQSDRPFHLVVTRRGRGNSPCPAR